MLWCYVGLVRSQRDDRSLERPSVYVQVVPLRLLPAPCAPRLVLLFWHAAYVSRIAVGVVRINR